MVMSGQVFESWTACLRSFSALIRISAAFLRSASDSMMTPSGGELSSRMVVSRETAHCIAPQQEATRWATAASARRKSAMRHDHPMKPATPDACCCGPDVSSAPAPSRRALLTASAGLAAGAAALPFLSDSARAQAAGANADGLLARVQGQRRILLKGGVVLTLDRGIGDFA